MYSTCLFCHADLGSNEVIESFPVGKRLAFDAEKGRLWAVCPRCGRWNLTPLEERWEAVEACERRFRGTVLRTSTDHIGLTRLREGLDLIRVGRPLRPELASWRYSSTFQRRWRKHAGHGRIRRARRGGAPWIGRSRCHLGPCRLLELAFAASKEAQGNASQYARRQ